MIGIVVIIILLAVMQFQVVKLSIDQQRRHCELIQALQAMKKSSDAGERSRLA